MRRLPRADRAIAAVLSDAIDAADLSARQLARRMKRPHNWVARFLTMERLPTGGELIVIAKALGTRASTLMARAERRLRT